MECCDNSGGRVILRLGNQQYSVRAGITMRPTNFSREAASNDDGTMYVTTKAEIAEAEFTLSDKCGLKINDLVKGCKIDATIILIDKNYETWLFTDASVVGRPEYKTDTGEITGLKIASAKVKQTN